MPAQQGQPCRVIFSASPPGRAIFEETADEGAHNLHFYLFSSSGDLISDGSIQESDGQENDFCLELPPDNYLWRISAGDGPSNPADIAGYDAHMPTLASNGYGGGFPMSAGGEVQVRNGADSRIEAVLTRNYCRIVLIMFSMKGTSFNTYGRMKQLRITRTFLMNTPDKVHMDGQSADGESGCTLLNTWNGNGMNMCGGTRAKCTIADFGNEVIISASALALVRKSLYCFPSSATALVVEGIGEYYDGSCRTWYWTLHEPFRAGFSYELSVTLTGPGEDFPIVGDSSSIELDITGWEETDGAGYEACSTDCAPEYTVGSLDRTGDCTNLDFQHIYGDTEVHPQDSSVVRSIGAGKHWKLFAVGAGQTAVYINDGLNLRELQFDIR